MHYYCDYEVCVTTIIGMYTNRPHLQELHPDLVEDAVKYIIFLVDADRLFDTALGMYDFSLVLMVAQHAQKVAPHSGLQTIYLTRLYTGP